MTTEPHRQMLAVRIRGARQRFRMVERISREDSVLLQSVWEQIRAYRRLARVFTKHRNKFRLP